MGKPAFFASSELIRAGACSLAMGAARPGHMPPLSRCRRSNGSSSKPGLMAAHQSTVMALQRARWNPPAWSSSTKTAAVPGCGYGSDSEGKDNRLRTNRAQLRSPPEPARILVDRRLLDGSSRSGWPPVYMRMRTPRDVWIYPCFAKRTRYPPAGPEPCRAPSKWGRG